jgi:hypothetical protein
MTTPPNAAVDRTTSHARTWAGVAVALGVSWTLLAAGLAPEPLFADPNDDPNDTDLDGMPNSQEFVLGTSQFVADSDGDGYIDAHELAFGSDPLDIGRVPSAGTTDLRVGITARGEEGQLRLLVALYSANGTFDTSVLRVGALANGQILSVPFHRLLPTATVRDIDVLQLGNTGAAARVRTIDLTLNPVYVHAFGETTFFVAAGSNGQTMYSSAAKVDVASVQQTLVLRREAYATQQQQSTSAPGGGSLRQPIPTAGPGGVPANWVAGQICYQRSSVTGMIGAKVLHEITQANCLVGWDTFCPADCSASVGDTYETIDPATLIGG